MSWQDVANEFDWWDCKDEHAVVKSMAEEIVKLREHVLAEHQAAVDMFSKYDEARSEYENVSKFATDFENKYAEVKAELEVAKHTEYDLREQLASGRSREFRDMQSELAIAREALKFYADPLAWCTMGEHAYADIGKVARQALKEDMK